MRLTPCCPSNRLDGLLKALQRDLSRPERNPLTTDSDSPACAWYTRHPPLERAWANAKRPAVIVLDGSADRVVSQRLFWPWPTTIVPIDVPPSPTVEIIQSPHLASTRRLTRDPDQLRRLLRRVAAQCGWLGLALDGGVCYKDLVLQCQAALGGTWLHYGGQRGSNALRDARALAIIASPTVPPDAIERMAAALWAGDRLLNAGWTKRDKGLYEAADERVEALNRLLGTEELRQAIHRGRPILASTPMTLLVCSPWDLTELGLPRTHIVDQLPHGNSEQLEDGVARYAALRQQPR